MTDKVRRGLKRIRSLIRLRTALGDQRIKLLREVQMCFRMQGRSTKWWARVLDHKTKKWDGSMYAKWCITCTVRCVMHVVVKILVTYVRRVCSNWFTWPIATQTVCLTRTHKNSELLAGSSVTSSSQSNSQAYNDAASSSASAVASAVSSICGGGDASAASSALAQATAQATAKAVASTSATVTVQGMIVLVKIKLYRSFIDRSAAKTSMCSDLTAANSWMGYLVPMKEYLCLCMIMRV